MLERQPVVFLVRRLEGLLDEARAELAAFVGASADDLVFVPNATTGVNTVLRSMELCVGDELLVSDHEYNACRNALDAVAAGRRARVVVARVPFPLKSPGEILEAVLSRLTRRTRLVLVDHVTSQTGLVMPIEPLVSELEGRGIPVLVDGAHAPGMVALQLDRLGASYYTGNCHKWVCAPKGAAFLWVRRPLQGRIRPLVISHGANSPRTDRSRFLIEFGWTGTVDPTPWLCIPAALRWMAAQVDGGWPAIRRRNRKLALAARDVLCDTLGADAPCPDSMIGSLASIPLPRSPHPVMSRSPLYLDPLQDALLEAHRIEVPVIPWPGPSDRVLRVSAQLYNRLPEYRRLASALVPLLAASPRAPAPRCR
jgi:isopenicillin-N epimerase